MINVHDLPIIYLFFVGGGGGLKLLPNAYLGSKFQINTRRGHS